ncbi:putative zinc ribbon protein, partial [Escherichia coli]|nr:putative zinc ribbon protein [Escherichia coli]
VSIKNDGHYFCRAGGNRPDGLNEPVTHLQGMTVPDYTVKVRKWFCVMCDEDYEGEKCCPRCGTGVYSRAWGRQEVPSEDARADNPLQRL